MREITITYLRLFTIEIIVFIFGFLVGMTVNIPTTRDFIHHFYGIKYICLDEQNNECYEIRRMP